MQACMLHNKEEFELLNEVSDYTEFESNIRGGLTTVVQGKVTFNNRYLKNFNSDLAETMGLFLDYNSLYPSTMVKPLPVGGFREFSPDEVKNFDYKNVDLDGAHCYTMVVDFTIADEVKRKTDDLPLNLCHAEVPLETLSPFSKEVVKKSGVKYIKQKSLIASHEDGKEHLISLELLRLLEDLGMIVTKVHKVYEFKQKIVFKTFIEKVIKLRTEATSKFESNNFKLILNSIFGKLLFNARKNSIQTVLAKDKETFRKYAWSPRLREAYPIDEKKAIMKLDARNIHLNSPLYMGWFILERSKYMMYDMYHNKLKNIYNDQMSLIYMDTDSLLLKFEGVDVYKDIEKGPLGSLLDTSNFPVDHPLYSVTNKGKLGLLKSETGAEVVAEAICLNPKTYSVLLNSDSNKMSAKGIQGSEKRKLTHKNFNDVHNGVVNSIKTVSTSITSRRNTLYSTKGCKNALIKLNRKRNWLDANKSLGFGHPSIKRPGTKDQTPKNSNIIRTKRKIVDLDDERSIDLTFRKCSKVTSMFM